MSLIKQIQKYEKEGRRTLFTTPSHSMGSFIESVSERYLGKNIFKCDYSEIDGFDNLRDPKNILKKLKEHISKIYKSKDSFILTNGSTSGILAAMLAVLKKGDKVIAARNCHVSVCSGLVLTGAVPIWLMPEYNAEWGIYESVNLESLKKLIRENPDAKAIILTSPTYEGVFSDIKEISKLAKSEDMKLIVDEAHGALLNFGHFKTQTAIIQGADISVQSLHKTAGALTPAALLHISRSSKIQSHEIQEALNLINTSSPSYPLMLSIEAVVNFLNSPDGKNAVRNLQKNIRKFTSHIKKRNDFSVYSGFNDPTKILFKYEDVNTQKISDYLAENKIEEEYYNSKSLLFITGLGTSTMKLFKLFNVLSSMDFEKEGSNDLYTGYSLPKQIMSPQEAYNKEKCICIPSETLGKVCAEPVLNYPPGIPIVVPGELIDDEIIRFIDKETVKVIKDY